MIKNNVEYTVSLRSRVAVYQIKFNVFGYSENDAKKKALKEADKKVGNLKTPQEWEIVAIVPVRQLRMF